ncbi:MAG: tryptophan synthase subunit beta, partial [Dehalococcoidia bacterium]|nr:tryptophan synthase subunit beta [Dehalococcoidia bacterium]
MTQATTRLSSRFGDFGGMFIPEVLVAAHNELEEAYHAALADPEFGEELATLQRHYVGRPTPLYFAER